MSNTSGKNFEAAIISVIWGNVSEVCAFNPVVSVYTVSEFIDDEFASYCVQNEATKFMEVTYKDLFVTSDKKHGTYHLEFTPEQTNIWLNIEETVTGWVTNSTISRTVCVGYFKFVKCDDVLSGDKNIVDLYKTANDKLRKEINDLLIDKMLAKSNINNYTNDIEMIESEKKVVSRKLAEANSSLDDANKFVKIMRSENIKLYDEISVLKAENSLFTNNVNELNSHIASSNKLIDELRSTTALQSEDNRRMLTEVDNMRKLNDKDLNCLSGLYSEISELKRMLMEKECEIANLREDAVCAVRTGSVPMKKTVIAATPAYDEVVDRIKNFDMSRLLLRKERDRIIKGKQIQE